MCSHRHTHKSENIRQVHYVHLVDIKIITETSVVSCACAAETEACRKLLTILGSVDMCIEPPQSMDLQLMSVPMIEQLVLNCQEPQQQQQGTVLCNVRLLHKILMGECQTLPAAMSGQRSLILEVPTC